MTRKKAAIVCGRCTIVSDFMMMMMCLKMCTTKRDSIFVRMMFKQQNVYIKHICMLYSE